MAEQRTGSSVTLSPCHLVTLSSSAAVTLSRFMGRHAALVTLLAVCAVGAIRHESFLTPENLFNVLRQNSMVGLLTLGMLIVMRSGGIDLSQGALLAVGGVAA